MQLQITRRLRAVPLMISLPRFAVKNHPPPAGGTLFAEEGMGLMLQVPPSLNSKFRIPNSAFAALPCYIYQTAIAYAVFAKSALAAQQRYRALCFQVVLLHIAMMLRQVLLEQSRTELACGNVQWYLQIAALPSSY